MLYKLFAAIGVCFIAGTAHGELRWDQPAQRFYRTPQDKFVEAKFSFKNVGKTPVTIKDVKTSCGCTSADPDKKTYAPGESGEIAVKFTFGGRVGGQRKTIRVFTTDQPDQPTVLDLTVLINEPFTVSPSLVFWKVGDSNVAKAVQLQAAPGRPVKVTSITSTNPRVTAALQTVKEGEQYVVSVKAADTTLREKAEIRVATDFPPDAPRTYTIHARIK